MHGKERIVLPEQLPANIHRLLTVVIKAKTELLAKAQLRITNHHRIIDQGGISYQPRGPIVVVDKGKVAIKVGV